MPDAISRDCLPLFRQLIPQADRAPWPVPLELRDILVTSQPDWTSSSWKSRFAATLRRV